MDNVNLRATALRDALGSSLWVLPALGAALGVVLGEAFGRLGASGAALAIGVEGSAGSARSVLSTIAGSTMTVTSLTLTLTVVALQIAAGQYSPRLMRTFLADRSNKIVLAVFLGTFAYALSLLRHVPADAPASGDRVPVLGVTVAVVFAMGAVFALVYFIHHVTNQLRVDKVVQSMAAATIASIQDSFEPAIVDDEPPSDLGLPQDPIVVSAPRSGHLNGIATNTLVSAATRAGLSVRLQPGLGHWVLAGSTLGWVWPTTPSSPLVTTTDDPDDEPMTGDDGDLAETVVVDASDLGPDAAEQARRLVVDHVYLGASRTLTSDPSFGIRQLVDIAIRAISPAINDPTTSVQAVHQIGRVLGELAGRQLGTLVRRAGDGFVVVPRPTFADMLRLAVDQVLRYGAREPAILRAIALMLADLAQVTDDESRHDALRSEAALVEATLAAAALPQPAAKPVADALEAVHASLGGRQPVMPAHAA